MTALTTLPVTRSLIAAYALAQTIEVAYSLSGVRCELISCSLRDTYRVVAREGVWVMAVYRAGWRTPAQIDAEWQFIGHLAAHGVSVTPALPTRQGELHIALPAPEGLRYGVLMAYASGTQLHRRSSPAAVEAYGRTVATIHSLADQLPLPLDRPVVDPAAFIARSAEAIATTMAGRPRELAEVQHYAGNLLFRLTRLVPPASPAYGIIHGDVIRANALIGDDGAVTVLDFDSCGPGWRAYDIASYLFTVRDTAEGATDTAAFLVGYGSVRVLDAAEEEALPLFEAARALFDLAAPALEAPLNGRATLDASFDERLERLRRCFAALPDGRGTGEG